MKRGGLGDASLFAELTKKWPPRGKARDGGVAPAKVKRPLSSASLALAVVLALRGLTVLVTSLIN